MEKPSQDIIIADATSTAPLTLWEADVDRLIESKGKNNSLLQNMQQLYQIMTLLMFHQQSHLTVTVTVP